MDVDVVVIGAGAVGLACAAALARRGDSVIVLEAERGIGGGVSSRNSEVIHGGMYYPHDSLRRRFCIEGRRELYRYLAARGVAHKKTGKLIVAVEDSETSKIEAIYKQGVENGVENMALIDGPAARAMEPNLKVTAAVVSPETGLIDSHGYMLALEGEIEDAGGAVVLATPVVRVEPMTGGGFRVTTGGAEPAEIDCRHVVNSAGLHAQAVARTIEGLAPEHIPQLTLAKGNYFTCLGKPAFSRLIYPAPVEGGLGVHVTLDLAGRMRFGPDVEWLGDARSRMRWTTPSTPKRAEVFYAAIRRYWPGLPDGALAPDYSGLRPKLSGKGEAAQDFRIDGPETHGLDGLVNLFGIESPGLTSSPAIAAEVARRLAS